MNKKVFVFLTLFSCGDKEYCVYDECPPAINDGEICCNSDDCWYRIEDKDFKGHPGAMEYLDYCYSRNYSSGVNGGVNGGGKDVVCPETAACGCSAKNKDECRGPCCRWYTGKGCNCR